MALHQPHRRVLDEHDVLVGHFLELQDRLEVAKERLGLVHLGRVEDEERVPVNDRLGRPRRQPGAVPGRAAFDRGRRIARKPGVEEIAEQVALPAGKHRLSCREEG
jgi:hypothetical protein